MAPEEEYLVMENQRLVTAILHLRTPPRFYLSARAGAQLGAVGSLLQQLLGISYLLHRHRTGQLWALQP